MILCILTYIIVCILMYFIPKGSAVAGNELDCVKQNLYFLMICEQDYVYDHILLEKHLRMRMFVNRT